MKKHLALVLGGLSWLGGCGGGSPSSPPSTPPTLILAPASLSFGVLVVGTESDPQVETLTNTGGSELAINSVGITGTNAADFDQNSTCGSSLGAGASCTLNVTFTPSQLGPRSASIIIADDAVVSSQTLSLTGMGGDSGPNATLSPTSLTFGDQVVGTASPTQSITLSNYGTATLSLTSIAASANFGETNTCNSTLASGATCTINVTFTPSESGDLSGALSMADDAAGSPQTVSLSGTGSTNTPLLTGYCFATCEGRAKDPAECPVGEPAESPGSASVYPCGPVGGSVPVDTSRACHVSPIRGGGHCVIQ